MTDENPFVKITGSEKKPAKIIRNRWSNFLFTVNVNKRFEDIENDEFKRLEDKLIKTAEYMCDQLNILNYTDIVTTEHSREDGIKYIKKIETMGQTEVGPKTGCLHMHGMVRFHHKTKIRLNRDKINKLFNDRMGSDCYLNIQGSSDTSVDFENYIRKYNSKV